MNEETIQLTAPVKTITDKKASYTYFIWCLILTNLLYAEYFGVNALISAILTISVTFALKKEIRTNSNWWVATALWLICGIGVLVNPHSVSILAYIGSGFYFISQSNTVFPNFFAGILHAFVGVFAGWVTATENIVNRMNNSEGNSNKWFRNVLIFSIPLVIVIVFLKLYQAADSTFYELTKFINLDWISWDFILVYLLVIFLAHGLFFFTPQKEFNGLANKMHITIAPTYKDKIEAFFGIKNENRIALSLLITLNIFLLLYNSIDVYHLFIANDLLESQSISETVHGGISALITSLILVMIIISYLFRGQLNFQASKVLKGLAVFWLIQNFAMISSTLIKNFDYINKYGLTYKRIGVYIYLFLALVGICLAIYKILNQKSVWFLFRKGSISFAFILSIFLTFNWNKVIVNYNLSQVQHERIDFNYLINLGPDAYKSLAEYRHDGAAVPRVYLQQIESNADYHLDNLTFEYENSTWRSYNIHDAQLKSELEFITKTKSHEL